MEKTLDLNNTFILRLQKTPENQNKTPSFWLIRANKECYGFEKFRYLGTATNASKMAAQ